MRNRRKVPAYRCHKPSGQAVVTLSGKDFYLGPHGTETSREEYDRVVAEWLANGRQLPQGREEAPALTVGQVLLRYWEHAQSYYGEGSGKLTPELYHVRKVLRIMRRLYSRTLAQDFGPRALKACREVLVGDGHVRRQVNQNVSRMKAVWRWAAEEELVPPNVYHGMQAVGGLKRGRTEAKEGKKVRPVAEEHLAAVLERVSPTVRAMIEVQLLTAMRPGELCMMRGCDIDRTVEPWAYRPPRHKTEHLGYERVIYLGPRAQAILQPLLEASGEGYVFSPNRAEEARNARRKLKRKSRRTPSQARRTRKANRRRPWREHYDKDSYRRAIERACAAAGIPKWTPHRLRHTAATRLRRDFGLDAAQAVLGHQGADVTQLYAEVEMRKAAQAMARSG